MQEWPVIGRESKPKSTPERSSETQSPIQTCTSICSTTRRRLQSNTFASLANRQLDGPPDDAPLGCSSGFALAHKVPSLGPEAVAAFVAIEATVVPLAADG